MRKICDREFLADEKYEEYDPKDLKYIYGHELRSVLKQRKAVEATKSNEESKSFSQSTEGSKDANYSKKWKSKFTEDQLKIPYPATEEWAARVRQDMADEYQWKMEQGMILGKAKRKEEDKENKNLREKGKETII